MAYYKDLREHIDALDKNGKLVRIKRKIDKDSELHPLVRWQFRGLPDKERKAFLFENVTDVKGRGYNSSVLVASHAASREVYALAMMCRPAEIAAKWEQAQLNPIKPKVVATGPVQEEIHRGDNLLEHGGLDEFPIPISTPGFDNAPYITAGNWVSKDPDTGIYNVGNYRAMVKSRTRTGCSARLPQHLGMNRVRYRQKGLATMPAAIVIGATPNVGLTAVIKLPYKTDEYDIAGGIAGQPLELVKCQTIDLEVPASAEIVIEGEIPTDYVEREGPFGEYTGYMGMGKHTQYFNVTCITHRKQPIWNTFLSQFPPSESSLLKQMGREGVYYKFLKYDRSVAGLIDVSFHNESGLGLCVIRMKNADTAEVWKALNGAVALSPLEIKTAIVVDEDIDPRDLDSVMWALCYRMQPHRDLQVAHGKTLNLDPSAVSPYEERNRAERPATSALMIDATRKWDYPPVSLPKQEFMERAKQIWEEEGLPLLTPKVPWYGYSLGYWSEEDEEESQLALKGEHYQTGKKLIGSRIKE